MLFKQLNKQKSYACFQNHNGRETKHRKSHAEMCLTAQDNESHTFSQFKCVRFSPQQKFEEESLDK
jgi:hypothetical protein